MSNMHYCRFENTLQDLQDCYEDMEVSSREEFNARKKLVNLCMNIAEEYEHIAKSRESFVEKGDIDEE